MVIQTTVDGLVVERPIAEWRMHVDGLCVRLRRQPRRIVEEFTETLGACFEGFDKLASSSRQEQLGREHGQGYSETWSASGASAPIPRGGSDRKRVGGQVEEQEAFQRRAVADKKASQPGRWRAQDAERNRIGLQMRAGEIGAVRVQVLGRARPSVAAATT
eukprot:4740699-Pyramimonas_sp.AAC.1